MSAVETYTTTNHFLRGGGFLSCGFLGSVVVLVCGLMLIVAGCGRGSRSQGAAEAITIAGSTSVQPFAEKLAEEYLLHHPQVRIDVQGGGSSAGIYAARRGAADLGASSRELAPSEKGLVEIPINPGYFPGQDY